MTADTPPDCPAGAPTRDDYPDEDFESIGDHHRLAAQHFAAAAKHHLAAAAADDEGLSEAAAHHAYLAYRQQLNGVQFAEIAVMDSELADDLDDAEPASDKDGTPPARSV